MLVKMDHFPKDPGENEKYWKPPPSIIPRDLGFASFALAPGRSSPDPPDIVAIPEGLN